jgi:hypothetical protein
MINKRTEKLKRQLFAMEEDLRAHLLSVLPEAVESGTDYFTNSDFNPQNQSIDSQTEALLHLAKESLSLRDQLQLPKQGSVGELYLDACAEAADLNNVPLGSDQANYTESKEMRINKLLISIL